MEEILNMISNYGVMVLIVALFLWDWIDNRKSIKTSLDEMSKTNSNTSKSLELLQKSMEDIHKTLDEHDKRGILILNVLEELKNK